MRMGREKKLLNSKKKKSNRDGKICREFRRLRKRARQPGKKEITDERG